MQDGCALVDAGGARLPGISGSRLLGTETVQASLPGMQPPTKKGPGLSSHSNALVPKAVHSPLRPCSLFTPRKGGGSTPQLRRHAPAYCSEQPTVVADPLGGQTDAIGSRCKRKRRRLVDKIVGSPCGRGVRLGAERSRELAERFDLLGSAWPGGTHRPIQYHHHPQPCSSGAGSDKLASWPLCCLSTE